MRSTDRRWLPVAIVVALVPMACGASHQSADESGSGGTPSAPFVEYDTAGSWEELAASSTAVVVGEPVGEVTSSTLALEQTADYSQPFSVTTVLKGSQGLAGERVTVVRLGLAGRKPRGGPPDHLVYGPLDPGRHVLFLQPGGVPGTWAVVGHYQGDLRLRNDRVIQSAFPAFEGQDTHAVRDLIVASDIGHHHDEQ